MAFVRGWQIRLGAGGIISSRAHNKHHTPHLIAMVVELTEKNRVSLLSAITFLNPYGAAQLSHGAIKLKTQNIKSR